MEKRPIEISGGRVVFGVTATLAEIEDGTLGFCVRCGEEADGVEPDAQKYQCEACGARGVFGLEQLLLMGLLTPEEPQAQVSDG